MRKENRSYLIHNVLLKYWDHVFSHSTDSLSISISHTQIFYRFPIYLSLIYLSLTDFCIPISLPLSLSHLTPSHLSLTHIFPFSLPLSSPLSYPFPKHFSPSLSITDTRIFPLSLSLRPSLTHRLPSERKQNGTKLT